MDRELARKSPARVIDSHVTPAMERRIGGKTMREVELKAAYLYRAGKILPDYTLHYRTDHRWEATVLLRPTPSWLRRHGPKLVLILFGVNFVVAAGYLLVRSILLAITTLAPFAIRAALIMAAVSLLAGGPRVIEVIQRVTIRR